MVGLLHDREEPLRNQLLEMRECVRAGDEDATVSPPRTAKRTTGALDWASIGISAPLLVPDAVSAAD